MCVWTMRKEEGRVSEKGSAEDNGKSGTQFPVSLAFSRYFSTHVTSLHLTETILMTRNKFYNLISFSKINLLVLIPEKELKIEKSI